MQSAAADGDRDRGGDATCCVSLFLAGGVLDRLARDRALGAGAFFSACGVYFVRFLRLGVIAVGRSTGLLFVRTTRGCSTRSIRR